MNKDKIIEMARQAGFQHPNPHDGYMGLAYDRRDGADTGASLEAFAKLVAAKEREACAELVENFEYQDKTGRHDVFFLLPHEHVAKAIRARGEA